MIQRSAFIRYYQRTDQIIVNMIVVHGAVMTWHAVQDWRPQSINAK
jgi:hypothetical protein